MSDSRPTDDKGANSISKTLINAFRGNHLNRCSGHIFTQVKHFSEKVV